MALSNRERVGKTFDLIAPPIDALISTAVAEAVPEGKDWTVMLAAVDADSGRSGKDYYRLDPQAQLRFLTEKIPSKLKRGWYPFNDHLPRVADGYISELRTARNDWAHGKSFVGDDAYRTLDTAERLMRAISANDVADQIKVLRTDLRRLTTDRDDQRTLQSLAVSPESEGLRPWREVLRPHEDVATGRFQASEFAADLYKVATQSSDQTSDYADPVEFFSRTYLTAGLRDLINRAVRRVAGDPNASPVINLQTNFGGGKTHSMLSLWHLAGSTPMTAYPQALQEVLQQAGFGDIKGAVRRVAIVGNHLSPSGEQKPDGTRVNTIWGELAWQLGGAEGYQIVAEADRTRTNPGRALHDLLQKYGPAIILIDEWVAYARQLYNREDVAGGTFETQFTFAQSLTEAAKSTPGILVAISIPASDIADESSHGAGSSEEVGGTHGIEALKRLQNVVRRVADQWTPASSDEAYHIVRQRLFVTPDAQALAEIGKAAKSYVEMYRNHSDHFPREVRDSGYEERIRRSYPIHPELFDRLYEDWATLERFQRTRGVLRLMNTVIYSLWKGQDAAPMIMPGSVPLGDSTVNSELTGYLPDQWKSVIDADVDGANSEPGKIDNESSLFGQRSITKRLARTVFFGAAPTIGTAHKGIEKTRVFLGTATPGDVVGNFHSALDRLADRATYFYSGSGKYWYDLQANITRRAKDQAERLHIEDVWAEVARRLQTQGQQRAEFSRVHVCPESTDDIPDLDEARLVIAHPRYPHAAKAIESAAMQFAHEATERRGTAHRAYRNMVVFLVPDKSRIEEVEYAARDFLGWSGVLAEAAELDLSPNQRQQAEDRRRQADRTVTDRLVGAYQWVLAPAAPVSNQPFVIEARKAEGTAVSLADRVAKKMISSDGTLSTRQAAKAVRLAITTHVPALWQRGQISVAELWDTYAKHPYMPRLRNRDVLVEGLTEQPMLWQVEGFALAASYDDDAERFIDLWLPEDSGQPPTITDRAVIVTPETAVEERRRHPIAKLIDTPDADAAGGTEDRRQISPDPTPTQGPGKFFATVSLGAQYGQDFLKISEEVLEHLIGAPGSTVNLTLEIEATSGEGFDTTVVRTVGENSTTLGFDHASFED